MVLSALPWRLYGVSVAAEWDSASLSEIHCSCVQVDTYIHNKLRGRNLDKPVPHMCLTADCT